MLNYRKFYIVPLLVIVVFFGFFHLTESPSFVFDEGWYFQTAANLATQGVDGLQFSPDHVTHISKLVTVGYPLIFPLALWFKIFSVGIFQARLFMVLIVIGLTVAIYFLAKKMYGNTIALAVTALLVTFPPLYGNGKTVMGEVPGLLFLVIFMICFSCIKKDDPHKTFWIILSGIFAGLCIATKPLFILILPAICIGVYIKWKRGVLSPSDIFISMASILVPILVWFFVQFRIGDSLSGVLAYYANPYSFGNLGHIIIANIGKLFSDVGTLYTVLLMAVWGSSIILRLRSKLKIPVEEAIAFIFSILIVLAYLRTSGMYRYLFTAQIVSLIFFPYAILYISDTIAKKISAWNGRRMFAIIVVILSVLGVYQLAFNSWVADTYSSHKTEYWEKYFANLPDSETVFFYNTPEVVPFIKSRNYYQYMIINSIGKEQLPVLAAGYVDKVIVPTVVFNENKDSVFKLYTEELKTYKYSILLKKH